MGRLEVYAARLPGEAGELIVCMTYTIRPHKLMANIVNVIKGSIN